MRTGVQFRGRLDADQTQRWFTHGWPATEHILWEVLSTTISTPVAPPAATGDGPQLTWELAVERADATHVTYWLTITNLTAAPVEFEARYCRPTSARTGVPTVDAGPSRHRPSRAGRAAGHHPATNGQPAANGHAAGNGHAAAANGHAAADGQEPGLLPGGAGPA